MGLLILAAHMLGDYVLQNDWMAANKFVRYRKKEVCRHVDGGGWTEVRDVAENFWYAALARTVHVTLYSLAFIPIAWLAGMGLRRGGLFVGLVFITHWITDCRRWASGEKWCAKPIMVDQTVHITTLAILAFGFGLR